MGPRTKIIATLGPASADYAVLRKMIRAGVDVVRLNFSHGTHAAHQQAIALVRQINRKYHRHVRILQDLEGFRIRVGHFRDNQPKSLLRGTRVVLNGEPDSGDPRHIPFDYTGDLAGIRPGQMVFIDDGNLALKVRQRIRSALTAEVVEGGLLKPRKGINMPGFRIPFTGLTAKDRADIEFGIHHEVDFVAQSFVRTPRDVDAVRRLIRPHRPDCGVIAKIESREAIRNIGAIIDAADGIMIARGDMGIALPIYQIPVLQKMIIQRCNRAGKPVITATQMLEHMTESTRPTRAEVTDVANAILDGTDYVMLSGETAAGKYPALAVKMMNDIILFTEASAYYTQGVKP